MVRETFVADAGERAGACGSPPTRATRAPEVDAGRAPPRPRAAAGARACWRCARGPGAGAAGAARHLLPAGGARRPGARRRSMSTSWRASARASVRRGGHARRDAVAAAGPFVDGDLTRGAVPRRRAARLGRGPRLAGDGPTPSERRLVAVCEAAQDLLDTVDRTCLVHSDLNPKNLLVDPDTLEVTGRRSTGSSPTPGTRSPTSATCSASTGTRRTSTRCWPPGRPCAAGRATRPSSWPAPRTCGRCSTWPRGAAQNPVADRAERLLRAIAGAGDLHAVPPTG